jgi:NADPH:quinone reductase-like Zn-dependent oxidoreductase
MRKWLKRMLKWTALTISALLVVGVVALFIAYWVSDNDCEERRATAPKKPMKAITYCEYGGPEVLQLEEVEQPVPNDDQVLVRMRAAALNPYDMHFLHGTPYFMRLSTGLRKPKFTRIGVDFSGVVETVGKNVTGFKPGDAVFGGQQGALVEYIVISEQKLVKKPDNISFEQAGAVNIAAKTALQALRDAGKLQPGQKVLINGASGGVGSFAVQIAKHLGAEVTGVSSGRNTELVRSLGADHTIDYTQQDYTQGDTQYDLIIDNVGNHSLSANRRVLKPNGRYVMVGGQKGNWIKPMDRVAAVKIYSMFVHQPMSMMIARASKDDLALLAELMQRGKVTPVIDKRYKLSEAAEAMRHLETGRARGKIVIQVD